MDRQAIQDQGLPNRVAFLAAELAQIRTTQAQAQKGRDKDVIAILGVLGKEFNLMKSELEKRQQDQAWPAIAAATAPVAAWIAACYGGASLSRVG